jgi:hypothetical protein
MSINRSRTLSFLVAIPIGTAFAMVPAGPALAATWSVVTTPAGTSLFFGVDATSTTNAWAVGRAENAPSQPFTRPLVARWNGTTWSLASTPTLGGELRGVDGSAATNAFAVGSVEVPLGGGTVTSGPLIERWNGTSWSVASSPTPPGSTGSRLSGVKTFSTTNAWAVGQYFASSQPFLRTLVQRFDGTSWSIVPSPNPDSAKNLLTDVDGASANDVWAIGNMGDDGYGGTAVGLVERWNGSAWSNVDVSGLFADNTISGYEFSDVVVSGNDVWIVGTGFHRSLFAMVPFSLRWNGQVWQRSIMTSAPNSGFNSVAAISSSQVYAFGGNGIARWNGTSWVAESATVPGSLADGAGTGTSTVWAVGYGSQQALAMRTTNG